MKVIAQSLAFPEALRWHEGRLWFSDILAGKIYSLDLASQELRCEVEHSGSVGGLGWLRNGELLYVACEERKVLRRTADGISVTYLDLSSEWKYPANELLVDDDETLWVGGYGYNPESEPATESSLARYAHGTLDFPIDGLVFPNGMARYHNDFLVVAETFADRISLFKTTPHIELVRRIQLPAGSTPDGLCISPSGEIMVACAYGEQILKVNPETGETSSALQLPEIGVYDCQFGGASGQDFFIATSSKDESRVLQDLPGKVLQTSL